MDCPIGKFIYDTGPSDGPENRGIAKNLRVNMYSLYIRKYWTWYIFINEGKKYKTIKPTHY